LREQENFKKYTTDIYFPMLNVCAKLKKSNELTKDYIPIDFNSMIQKKYLANMKEYNQITAPKKIRFENDKFTKQVIKMSSRSIDLIEFDEMLFNQLMDKFLGVLDDINNFSISKMKPLNVLYYYRSILKDKNINVSGLRKYLAHCENFTERKLIDKNIYTKRTISRYKKLIKEIDLILFENGKLHKIDSIDIPEKINYCKWCI